MPATRSRAVDALPIGVRTAARRLKHNVEPLVEGVRRATAGDRRALQARVREAMTLPPLPPRPRARGSVWAVTMVKDEADILGLTLAHLLAQGVDAIIVADNGSSDGTRDIIREFGAQASVHLALDAEPAYLQSYKMSLLAEHARAAGADWIVPFDADEFWFARGGRLADVLRRQRSAKARARVHCAFPASDLAPGDAGSAGWRLDDARYPEWLDKMAFRSHRFASIEQGNHSVVRPGEVEPTLGVIHVPWRSFEQFRRKVRQGAAAVRASGSRLGADHWLELDRFDDDELRERWRMLLAGGIREEVFWRPRGQFLAQAPLSWESWDPDGLLPRLESYGPAAL